MKFPRHIAFIMDGNGRWAKNKNLPIAKGHEQGLLALEGILDHCFNLGIKTITLYAFSSENWKRSDEEKKILFNLLLYYFNEKLERILKRNTRIKIIGNTEKFPEVVQTVLKNSEDQSKHNNDFLLQMALGYGGRDEIVRATKKIYQDLKDNKLMLDKIDVTTFADYLDTAGVENPDFLIRTSGEMRVSNFLLYQTAYTEFYFTSTLWPDFKSEELDQAIAEFNRRERRFGSR